MSSSIPTETGFTIEYSGESSPLVSETPSGKADVRAAARHYSVAHPDATLELRLVAASNGERWVEARNVVSLHSLLSRLEGRLRLAIDTHGSLSLCALRLAAPRGESRAHLRDATLSELDHAAGIAVARELRGAGAVDVGTRNAIFGDTGRTRRRLIATFANENIEVPILGFVLTRLAPLVAVTVSLAESRRS